MSDGGKININFSNDPSYRYKMPQMKIRSQGRGNGVSFVIENMRDLCLALRRLPDHVTKFFQFNLGNGSSYNNETGEAVFKGQNDRRGLTEVLKTYIFGYVLCPKCKNPETDYDISPQRIMSSCRACGHTYELRGLPNFLRFMTKNPNGISAEHTESERARATTRLSSESVQKKLRKIMKVESIPLADKLAQLDEEISKIVESNFIVDEEVVPLLIASYFDSIHQVNITKYKSFISIVSHYVTDASNQIALLYSLECLVRKFEKILLDPNSKLLAGMFQHLIVQEIVSIPIMRSFKSETSQPYVPMEYHNDILEQLDLFFSWFEKVAEDYDSRLDKDGENREDENEEEYSYGSYVYDSYDEDN